MRNDIELQKREKRIQEISGKLEELLPDVLSLTGICVVPHRHPKQTIFTRKVWWEERNFH